MTAMKPVRFEAFQFLPPAVVRELHAHYLRESKPDRERRHKELDLMRGASKPPSQPRYTPKQLKKIITAAVRLNTAIGQGIPTDVYEMLARAFDANFAHRVAEHNAVWYGGSQGWGDREATRPLRESAEFAAAKLRERDKRGFIANDHRKRYHLTNPAFIGTYLRERSREIAEDNALKARAFMPASRHRR